MPVIDTYTASLIFSHGTPENVITIPVTMKSGAVYPAGLAIAMRTATGLYEAYDPAASGTGVQVAAGILRDMVDATASTMVASMIVKNAVLFEDQLTQVSAAALDNAGVTSIGARRLPRADRNLVIM